MNVTEFIQKWRKAQLTERSASQQHCLDLCAPLDHPTPAGADPEGASFTFERGVHRRGVGDGWAGVWRGRRWSGYRAPSTEHRSSARTGTVRYPRLVPRAAAVSAA